MKFKRKAVETIDVNSKIYLYKYKDKCIFV